ncbi:MAG: c-type cytochrome [Pseudomonadota bacterium]
MAIRAPLTLALSLLASAAAAQDPDRVAEGEAIFAQLCVACHGATATGGGPMQSVLAVPIPDLTDLAIRADGFPHALVIAKIDGRDPLLGHGGAMPVWGDFFEGDAAAFVRSASGQPIVTSEPIAALVAWLESIQQ